MNFLLLIILIIVIATILCLCLCKNLRENLRENYGAIGSTRRQAQARRRMEEISKRENPEAYAKKVNKIESYNEKAKDLRINFIDPFNEAIINNNIKDIDALVPYFENFNFNTRNEIINTSSFYSYTDDDLYRGKFNKYFHSVNINKASTEFLIYLYQKLEEDGKQKNLEYIGLKDLILNKYLYKKLNKLKIKDLENLENNIQKTNNNEDVLRLIREIIEKKRKSWF